MIRRTIHFTGRVQGVGFRYTTQSIAARFAVTGYVRNLPDGRVELVAEGEQVELDRFQKAVEEAMDGCIERAERDELTATGEFAHFFIAR